MREAVGSVLALAVAAALSPFPIIGVVLMLVTPRARVNGPLFVVGWIAGFVVVGAIGLTVGGAIDAGAAAASSGVSGAHIVLGLVLLVLAYRQWQKRPAPGEEPPLPRWMDAVADLTPMKAAVTGAALSAVNPKNLLLTLAAATTIASSGLPGSEQVVVYAIYVALATVGVAIPLVLFFAMGPRAQPALERLRLWLAHNNATIMAVLFLLIGAKVLGDGIAG